jgi:hypothetical protein
VAELGGPGFKLTVGDSLEYVANHEVKELGHHVLACVVSYHLPPSYRHAPSASDPSNEATFRKFYKFAVCIASSRTSNDLNISTENALGHEPSFCKDKGTHASVSISFDDFIGARESVS